MPTSRDYKAALNNSISGVDGTIWKCNCNFNYHPIRKNWAFTRGGSWSRRMLKKKVTFESGLNSVRQRRCETLDSDPHGVAPANKFIFYSPLNTFHEKQWEASKVWPSWLSTKLFKHLWNFKTPSKNSRLFKLHLADTNCELGTSEWMCPIFLPMLSGGRDSLCSLRPPLSDRALVIVPPRPREARKPANLKDPAVRSTSDRSFSSPQRRTAAKTNRRSFIHSGSGCRMLQLCD